MKIKKRNDKIWPNGKGFFIHFLFINHQSQITLKDGQHLVFIARVTLQSFLLNLFMR